MLVVVVIYPCLSQPQQHVFPSLPLQQPPLTRLPSEIVTAQHVCKPVTEADPGTDRTFGEIGADTRSVVTSRSGTRVDWMARWEYSRPETSRRELAFTGSRID